MATRLDGGEGPTASEISSPPIGLAPPQVQSPIIVETPGEATRTQTPPALSTEEVWRTPATQQEAVQQPDPTIDPQIMTTEAPLSIPQARKDSQFPPFSYPMEGTEEVAMQEADDWLDDLGQNFHDEWLYDPVEVEPSPLTSMAADTRAAQGNIYKACRCPEHQELYND